MARSKACSLVLRRLDSAIAAQTTLFRQCHQGDIWRQ